MSTRMPRSRRSSKPSKRASRKQGASSKTNQGTRTASLFSQGDIDTFSVEQLCIDLLHADTEEEVIRLLADHGYWDDPSVWRLFSDDDSNYQTFGNQTDSADAALVEKLVNSVDAVLMGECWAAGIEPNSPDAPKSIEEAVAQFFFDDRSKANTLGHISRWPTSKRRELSERITLAATGSRQNPSFTIVDSGEGQTPNSMPDTLLSLTKANKIDVHFVQGKFHMGGTAALRFCGTHNLQLVISRRNPNIKLMNRVDSSLNQWGFTIVRREDPTESKRLSTYTYLAPEADQGILRFNSDVLSLFPQGNNAYVRNTTWGTAIKLYEYKLKGRSHILRRDGLLYRLDLLLPGVPLPIRLYEARDYSGHEGSYSTTLTGLGVRLSDDRADNLEPRFPTGTSFTIAGQEMTAEVYAFKRGKDETYRKDEGIIFTLNGQTQGKLSKKFFSRKSVGMNSLEDSLLVIVDCSRISGRAREVLFMNSRDRMEQGEFLSKIERELESILKENQLLRELKERRRREDVESKLQDSKPFKEVLESIIRKSPSLAQLLGGIGPLHNPFRPEPLKPAKRFPGRMTPSYFRFRELGYGQELKRTTAINMRSRVVFETDVVNDYFTRSEYAGRHVLRSHDSVVLNESVPDHTLNLQDGVATLNLSLHMGASIGDSFRYELIVEDETMMEPFVNRFVISVGPYQKPSGGGSNRGDRKAIGEDDGENGETPQGLRLPTPVPVYESEWARHNFNRDSALKAVYYGSDDEPAGSHTYYINMDNIHLKTELKTTKENPEIVKSRWQYGMVLIGMALLRNNSPTGPSNNVELISEMEDVIPEHEVAKLTEAVAPVLLPLIEHLGALTDDDVGLGT